MELTEFDKMMNSLMNDEKEVPKELNLKLKKKIRAKYRYNKLVKSIPMSAVACIAVGVFLVSAINDNEELLNVPQQNVNEAIISQEIVSKEQPLVEKNNIKTQEKTIEVKREEPVIIPNNEGIAVAQVEPNEGIAVAQAEPNEGIAVVQTELIDESEDMSLIEYLENDEEKILLVSERIKEQMSADEEIDYYKEFESIVGDEEYYLTDECELVIIFDEGEIAPEEHGKLYFNVGIIDEA